MRLGGRAKVTGAVLAAFALMQSLASPVAAQRPAGSMSCPALRWVTLGTAGGPVPTPERSEPANLLIAGDAQILVDAGDGTVDQLARLGLDLGPIRSLFVSHHHLDHTGGLAAVIGLRWMNQFPGQLTIYGPPGTADIVDGILASMGPPSRIGFGIGRLPPSPRDSVRVVEIGDGWAGLVDGLRVAAVANSHYDAEAARTGILSLSYRFDLGGRSIVYTGDTGPGPAVTRLARGADLLVSEVIDLDRLVTEIRQRRPDASPEMLADMRRHLSTHHLPAAEVGRIAAEARVGHVVLTHLAIPPGPTGTAEHGLLAGVRQAYGGPVDVARDLGSFDVGCGR
jgi:ribonuclease BN (tRNA processing enzyme)